MGDPRSSLVLRGILAGILLLFRDLRVLGIDHGLLGRLPLLPLGPFRLGDGRQLLHPADDSVGQETTDDTRDDRAAAGALLRGLLDLDLRLLVLLDLIG